MLKTFLTAGAVLFLGAATATAQTSGAAGAQGKGQQMTQAECQSLWSRADAGTAGSLTETQAQQYVTDFDRADTNNDSRLSSAEFMAACQQGMARSTATTGAGGGTGGGATGVTPGTTGSGTKK